MVYALSACGFNGFQQISGFQKVCLEGWTNGCTTTTTSSSERETISFPTPLNVLQLQDSVQVKKVVFTWARIAAVFTKDGDTVSVITGCQGKCSQTNSIQENVHVFCASELHLFLRHNDTSQSQYELKCLDEEDVRPQLLHIRENNQAKSNGELDLYASHSDVYYSRGAFEFGKIQFEQKKGRCQQRLPNIVQLCPQVTTLKIKQISCGKEHVLFLSCFGCIYSCGLGSRGQLGHCDVEMEREPKVIEALEGIHMIEIQAGGWHSVSVSECGDIYAWGWNESGQLGISSPAFETEMKAWQPGLVAEPTFVSLPQEVLIKSVACGSRHTLLMTECGMVFSSGWNAYGQLGLMHTRNQFNFVRVVTLSSPCKQIYAGHWCSIFLCCE